jgi:hypothetical protein
VSATLLALLRGHGGFATRLRLEEAVEKSVKQSGITADKVCVKAHVLAAAKIIPLNAHSLRASFCSTIEAG